MKNSLLPVIALSCLFALDACTAKNPHPMDMTTAVGSAATSADHMALARHYEEAAADAQAKVAEHKKLLAQYKEKSYLYGKGIYNFEEHCDALIRIYQQAVDANLKMAEMHKKLAQASS